MSDVTVTQADREAAKALVNAFTCFDCADTLTSAFAAHRIAAISTACGDGRAAMSVVELIERLRVDFDQWTPDPTYDDRQEAADTIDTLAAENQLYREVLGEICKDSNGDWTEKRVYPNDVLDDIHTMAVEAYFHKRAATERQADV